MNIEENNSNEKLPSQQFFTNLALSIFIGVIGGILLAILESYKTSLNITIKESYPNESLDILERLEANKKFGLIDYFTKPEAIEELQSLRKYG